MKKIIWTFGGLAAAMILLMQLSKYSLLTGFLSWEVVVVLLALTFAGLGLWVGRWKREKPQPLPAAGNAAERKVRARELGISPREFEVLVELSAGLSNREIAGKLFVSESTVKTHVSNLLLKLEARRRTEAVRIAREQGLI